MKTAAVEQKYQYLGKIYQLIEQFELISRTDLAKLSEFAPAAITGLSKQLIDAKLVIERTAQNLPTRGRPAVGLSLSPFHWRYLCVTLAPTKISIFLCELSGSPIEQKHYSFNLTGSTNLAENVTLSLNDFLQRHSIERETLLAISVSVIGKLNRTKTTITQLGGTPLECELLPVLQKLFIQPVYLNEHFQLWLLTESMLGRLISHDDVIFLQLDEVINLSVLLRGELWHRDEHKRMNVDKMLMPRFGALSDEISEDLDEKNRYQLANQITFAALAKAVDRYLPNTLPQTQQKMRYLCEQIQQENPQALQILEHITDNLSYMLFNLISIFSTEKIMFCSPLLSVKSELFAKIREKITANLPQNDLHIDFVTCQYEWNSPFIPAVAIKYEIYAGNLIKNIIKL